MNTTGKKTRGIILCILNAVSTAYLLSIIILPDGLSLRAWYRSILLLMIIVWQALIVLYAIRKKKVAIWICSVIVMLFLALVWIGGFLSADLEYTNANGTITVVRSDGFLRGSSYSLWEKHGLIYRKYIRSSFNKEDIDPYITKEQFMKDNYPDLYKNMIAYRKSHGEEE